ncbi:MAG: radical SAM protein [Firmicutes bacterium]|nr:radical SAM protein [Bacillota bacterium]
MKNRELAIYCDQRIAEEFCNFRCEYCEGFCPTDYSLKRDENGSLHVAKEWFENISEMPESVQSFFEKRRGFEEFYSLARQVMLKNRELMETDILKISGGELSVYHDLCNFVNSIHRDYKMIQILSNGSNIREEDISKYKKMGNIVFQISIDGVTPAANYSKSHSEQITKKVVETIEKLLDNGIGVEINCVLTKYNTDKFKEFLEQFGKYEKLCIVPRPVRGEPRQILDANREQIESLEKCIDSNYYIYSSILPPISYFERMIEIMKTGERNYNCYIPYFVQSIDGYGNLEKCPIGILYSGQKNVLSEKIDSNKILINSGYDSLKKHEKCHYCINQYEMFNLFVDDIIKLDELRKLPSLNNDEILSDVQNIKRRIKVKEK